MASESHELIRRIHDRAEKALAEGYQLKGAETRALDAIIVMTAQYFGLAPAEPLPEEPGDRAFPDEPLWSERNQWASYERIRREANPL